MTFSYNLNLINWIFQNILNRSITASNRSQIWEDSISWIAKHPLIGYGYLYNEEFYHMIGAIHPHNKIIYTLFIGGLLLTIWVFITYLYASLKWPANTNNKIGFVIYSAITVSIISYFSELRNNTFDLYPILIIACNSEKLQNYVYVAKVIVTEKEGKYKNQDSKYIKSKPFRNPAINTKINIIKRN
jgi:hypothetical protein